MPISGTMVEVNEVTPPESSPRHQGRFFRARAGWSAWYMVGASGLTFLALSSDGIDIWFRLALALSNASLFVVAFRRGVRVGPAGVSTHPRKGGNQPQWNWDSIVAFDHPEARLGGDAARGQLQLLLETAPPSTFPRSASKLSW